MPSKINSTISTLQIQIDNLNKKISEMAIINQTINKITKIEKPPLYGLTDLISGKIPTLSGWTNNPTDTKKITDGDPTTICTTGNRISGGGYQYAYFEWDLGATYYVSIGGFGGANTTAGYASCIIWVYTNSAWVAAHNTSSYIDTHPFMGVTTVTSKIRLGITASVAATITPSINSFNVWRLN